jgi:tetrahydromethanopterin S-methyltransferase subunit G
MPRPDLPQERRIERLEEDFQAVTDTLDDIQTTVHQHTATLADHGRQLANIRERLDGLETRVETGFAEILRRLDNR